MLEIFSPFSYTPDVLVIELPKDSARLKIQAFESEWGPTDEILCYWDGILFGQATPNDNLRFAKLLPKLDRQRNYHWPSADSYASAMVSLLTQFPQLEVWCERDCDQYDVARIDTIDELFGQLKLAQSYCLNGRIQCPSFSYRPVEKN
ncbi:hypothetical protein [Janthinobacterium sp. BJB304]|uniref:hypothetical protein n=1 Tax=Janthinobacterium sp. BJB304 TaxID=1572871 RepID=UPI00117A856C|nr:hypothetical protein [Janthinobacterium sp. BJB304]